LPSANETKFNRKQNEKNIKNFSSKSLPRIKKSFTFAPRKTGSSLRGWQVDLEKKGNQGF